MSVFMLCERTLGFLAGKRLTLTENQLSMLEALDYGGLTEDKAQQEAVACARHFGFVRDSLLFTYPWVFARKSAALAEMSEALPGWRHTYALPADCLRLIEVVSSGHARLDYEVSGTSVSCDHAGVSAGYTAKSPDTAQWPALFSDVFCARLAAETAPSIMGEGAASVFQAMSQYAQASIGEAYRLKVIDEGPQVRAHVYQWDGYFNDLSERERI
ncbi:MAG: hypothetical protein LBR87_03060 [Synergistaceae bacterium]|jgi:hypothetical protein|nr:hypothetical protein [Synergistaceae bacterium]